jgi:phosphoribosylaminoimidazole-succinocarboxamide synthase
LHQENDELHERLQEMETKLSNSEEEIANASLARREETLQELQRVQELEAHVVAVLSASQPES